MRRWVALKKIEVIQKQLNSKATLFPCVCIPKMPFMYDNISMFRNNKSSSIENENVIDIATFPRYIELRWAWTWHKVVRFPLLDFSGRKYIKHSDFYFGITLTSQSLSILLPWILPPLIIFIFHILFYILLKI